GARSSVVDGHGSGLGDRPGDVARTQLLLRVAAVAATSRAERVLLRAVGPRLAARYLRCYSARLPLDQERLERWEVVHLLHGWAQGGGPHAGVLRADPARGRGPPPPAPRVARRP